MSRFQGSGNKEALEHMPLPRNADAELRVRVECMLDQAPPASSPSMAEFDAREYDEQGQPR